MEHVCELVSAYQAINYHIRERILHAYPNYKARLDVNMRWNNSS